MNDLIKATATEAGIPQRTFTDREIVERSSMRSSTKARESLEDGFAGRASDIDVIYANGYGFPAWRGGPMFYADLVGLPVIHERVAAFHREHGERWSPAPLLSRLAATGGTFRDHDRRR